MLEWVCPQCDRLVDPAFQTCPHCSESAGAVPKASAVPRQKSAWAVVDRVSRMLIWLVATAALVYFFVFAWAYHTGNDELMFRLARWIPRWR